MLLKRGQYISKALTRSFLLLNKGNFGTATLPQLTKDRYPIKRKDFTELNESHIKFFRDLIGEKHVINDPLECESYNTDWLRSVRGYSNCVLKPKTTDEISKILKYCNDNKLAVCPQGGNTGLVGGSVPVFDEIIISLSSMNKIINIDNASGVLICESGCILENLDDNLAQHDLMMPIDLGAKGSCHIGGNVSTNAGGLRLLRYGSLHANILGVEVVKANGEILDLLSTLKKDNTGFHLKHLFIGSEGCLGIVTKVSIQCPPRPKSIHLGLFGVESFEKILKIFKKAKIDLGEILSSFEMMDGRSLDSVTEHLNVKSPLNKYDFYILVETQGSNTKHDEEKFEKFSENLLEQQLVLDGTVTSEPSKMTVIWKLREGIAEAVLHDGYVFKYDLSLPLEKFYSVVPVMNERLGKDAIRCCGYGHIGDGNIHLNVSVREFNQEIYKKIEPFVFEYISSLRGSVSAEHGIGFKKTQYITYSKSESAVNLMKDIKQLIDPKGILNPYKVLP